MIQHITTINVWGGTLLLQGAGGVNCYLVETDTGHILIDTGFHSRRAELVKELEGAGCRSGTLKLIVITHGDLDHMGNCAFLRDQYGAPVALHREESPAVASVNMGVNRASRQNPVSRALLSLFSWFSRSDRFKPDCCVEEGNDLAAYGFHARVLHLPGHSKGSIGILTADGDLFCGDLLWNHGQPGMNTMLDDAAAARASVKRLESLPIRMVYPGHGKAFAWQAVDGAGQKEKAKRQK